MKQFRVLYRQFLFRLMDVELFAASARGDANTLLGQFGALLIFGSVLLSLGAVTVGQGLHNRPLVTSIWAVERFLVSLTMLVVGVFALLGWDSVFPDRRDVQVLSPLPVRARTLFAAKMAASGSALVLIVAAWNSIAGFAWPVMLTPRGSGFVGTMRFVAAFWITCLAASTFLYCALLGVQAVAAQLPRAWYLRVSSVIQIGAFLLFLGVFFFQPSLTTAADLGAPENQRALAWLPSYWFMGLLSELSGAFRAESHQVMAPLARRAVASVLIAITIAVAAFLLSYVRTLRKIVEEPDIVPGTRGGVWLPQFGSAPQTAIAQFAIRTLVRSRQHRAILGFYLAGGFAIAMVYLEGARTTVHVTWMDLLNQENSYLLAASVLLLSASLLGIRTVFSLPLDLRANWLFRVTPSYAAASCLPAIRLALLVLSVLPVAAVSGSLLFCFRPWITAVKHLLLLVLLGSILADFSLIGFRKIPFTCSYLPGKSKVHMLFWFGVIPLVIVIHEAAALELRVIPTTTYWLLLLALGAVALFTRMTAATDKSTAESQFEESASDELLALRL